jgi:hypothetical protein
MPGNLPADFVRRERVSDTLLEFERRIRERLLSVDESECWDLLANRPATRGGTSPYPAADPLPLRYETHDRVSLLRVVLPAAQNRACVACDLFGRCHCCGGLVFLYYALRETGVPNPMNWLALQLEPHLYLPDWELMQDNSTRITRKLRDFFEMHLERVSAEPEQEA